jgi:hypothetical protein
MKGITLTATEEAVAAHAVQRQIAEIRDLGIEVEVLHDAGIVAVVRIVDDDGAPITLTIDPMGIAQRARNARMN